MTGKKRGRPRLEIDPIQVEAMAEVGCTVEEIAHVLRCSKDTLERNFAARIDAGRARMRHRLRAEQVKIATNPLHEDQARMLIHLGKTLLGQRERTEVTGADGAPLVPESTVSPDALIARILATKPRQ